MITYPIIINSEITFRSNLVNDFSISESEFFSNNSDLVNQLDKIGYLLSSAVTLFQYKKQTTAAYSYLLKKQFGVDNSMKPYRPNLAFARGIFGNYLKLISKDVYNDYENKGLGIKNWGAFKNTYQHNIVSVPTRAELQFSKYQLTEFAKENMILEVASQSQNLVEMTSLNSEFTNYNIGKILNEARLYLEKTNA